jgi:tyrosyl-tRNA synthetase
MYPRFATRVILRNLSRKPTPAHPQWRAYSDPPASVIRHVDVDPGHSRTPRSALLKVLRSRGLISQATVSDDTFSHLAARRKLTFYAGIDPTAPSLHLGHLLPLMVLFWATICGHNAISLIGGATARVGDPTGRLASRKKVGEDIQTANLEGITNQVKGLWWKFWESRGKPDEDTARWQVLNNADWLGKVNILEFLKVVGSGTRVGTMLGKDT